jgi:hypothetical protein
MNSTETELEHLRNQIERIKGLMLTYEPYDRIGLVPDVASAVINLVGSLESQINSLNAQLQTTRHIFPLDF